MKQVDLVYIGRSGKFKKGKTYKSTWTFTTRGGSKSPSTWVFKLDRFKQYRVMPYEFSKYWDFKDLAKGYDLTLIEIYTDSTDIMRDLIYDENPFLSMLPKRRGFSGAYFPVPLVYGDPK